MPTATATATLPELPSHASPIIAPLARPSSQYISDWSDLQDNTPSTPALPPDLLSPAFTPPSTPGFSTPSSASRAEPKSTPVDTSILDPSIKAPRLLDRLPVVECIVRARIPTTSGAEMFLHLYRNDTDDKEHLAIVFGNQIRSRSLDAERPGETEMDRMIRGAYVGRLRPGRTSSRLDDQRGNMVPGPALTRTRSKKTAPSGLKHVTSVAEPENADEVKPDTDNGYNKNNTNNSQPDHSRENPNTMSTSTVTPAFSIQPSRPKAPLVRIHSECYTGETAWSARCDCGEQLDEAARLMSLPSSTGGVIVYLRQEGRGIGLASKLKAYNLQDLGNDTVEANLLLRHPADARTYGLATAILVDLGLGGDSGIRLLTNNPDKVRAVEGPGREVRVRERVAMVPLAWRTRGREGVRGAEIERYLNTKMGRMGHMIWSEQDKQDVVAGE